MDTTESEHGFAIVAALWAAAILAVVILSVLQIVRADARLGRGREEVAEMNAAADAAVNITILSLLGPQATQPAVNAVPFTVPFAGYTARVSVQDEAGKIDLNMASVATLRALLLDAGLDTGSANDIADRILAWRGTVADRSDGGDDRSPTHRQPFQSVEELQLVAGLTPELYRRIAPLVTVYSQTPGIDPTYSSLRVVHIFKTIDPNAEAAWLHMEEIRAGLRPADPSPGVALGHAFTITVEVEGAAAARAARTATIRLTGHAQEPLLIYRWN